jgi:adenylate cyclase
LIQALARLIPVPDPKNRAIKEALLAKAVVTIGRSPRADVLVSDPEVSKVHAEIALDDTGFVIRDLKSSNGTFVNGQQIFEQLLAPGDLVEIGGCSYTFQPGEAGRRRSSVTIVAASPIDKTQVLATTQIEALRPAREIADVTELRRRYERVRTAFEAVGRLIETTDIALLCQRILEVCFRLVRAENGAVMLFDTHENLVPWATKGQGAGENGDMLISKAIVEQVIRRKEAVLASDALTDSRFKSSESVISSGVRSLMCVPLLSGDNVYGLLHVGNATQVAAFAQSDLELVSGIGVGGGVALSNAFMTHRLAEEARSRESLGRFLSPVLVDQVMQQGLELKRGGEERTVTVLFADIRGFTSLTERSRPADVVSLLNEYFDQMVEVVFAYGGALDKFIGDAVMAVWGTPVERPNDAQNAVEAARDMQDAIKSLNEMRRDRGEDPIGIGVGLATGTCISGAIGARRRMEYTVIGDAVNLASRFAGMAKAGEVLCDDVTFKKAGSPASSRELAPAQVKGKTHPVAVFQIRAESPKE